MKDYSNSNGLAGKLYTLHESSKNYLSNSVSKVVINNVFETLANRGYSHKERIRKVNSLLREQGNFLNKEEKEMIAEGLSIYSSTLNKKSVKHVKGIGTVLRKNSIQEYTSAARELNELKRLYSPSVSIQKEVITEIPVLQEGRIGGYTNEDQRNMMNNILLRRSLSMTPIVTEVAEINEFSQSPLRKKPIYSLVRLNNIAAGVLLGVSILFSGPKTPAKTHASLTLEQTVKSEHQTQEFREYLPEFSQVFSIKTEIPQYENDLPKPVKDKPFTYEPSLEMKKATELMRKAISKNLDKTLGRAKSDNDEFLPEKLKRDLERKREMEYKVAMNSFNEILDNSPNSQDTWIVIDSPTVKQTRVPEFVTDDNGNKVPYKEWKRKFVQSLRDANEKYAKENRNKEKNTNGRDVYLGVSH